MTRILSRTLGVLLAAAAIGGTGQAQAAFTLTLDNPNPTVTIPSSGFIDYAFTGTLTLDINNTVVQAALQFPFQGGNPPQLVGSIVNFPYTDAENGGTFTGTLFTIHIESTSALGFYDQRSGGGPATFTVTERGPGGESQSRSVEYTITLTEEGGQPTPEPASVVLAGIGGLFAIPALVRRRSPKAC